MFLDYIFISSQVPCKLGDHYRRSLGLLWAFGGFQFSVFTFHLSVFRVLLYNIVLPYLRHFSSFVPKIGDFGEKSDI